MHLLVEKWHLLQYFRYKCYLMDIFKSNGLDFKVKGHGKSTLSSSRGNFSWYLW